MSRWFHLTHYQQQYHFVKKLFGRAKSIESDPIDPDGQKIVFWGGVLVLLGWFAYNNPSVAETNPATNSEGASIGSKIDVFLLTDFQGKEWSMKDFPSKKAIVFAFVLVMAIFLWGTDKLLEFLLYDLVLGLKK